MVGTLSKIDQYDVELLRHWLSLARLGGTNAIKIVCGSEPNTYKVTIVPKEVPNEMT